FEVVYALLPCCSSLWNAPAKKCAEHSPLTPPNRYPSAIVLPLLNRSDVLSHVQAVSYSQWLYCGYCQLGFCITIQHKMARSATLIATLPSGTRKASHTQLSYQ